MQQITDACEQRVGTTVGQQWRLDGVLGIGGMGAVYRAVDLAKNRNVAVKILHLAYATQESVRARFLREGMIGNQIHHEGAPEVFGQGSTDDNCPFLVMELLEGQSLEDIIEAKGRLAMSEALGVADGVLAVLEAAHAAGVVHRDIKPDNIFITNDRKLKLLDFGIAQLRQTTDVKLTSTGSLLGTPWYMPPEQALGRNDDIGPATDIWAVGSVIFRLLTGEPVHPGDTPGEVLVAAATRPARSLATLLPEAPVELVMLVDQSLSYDIAQRIQDARGFRVEIRSVARQLADRGKQTTAEESAPREPEAASQPRSVPSSLDLQRAVERQGSVRQRALGRLDGLAVTRVGAGEVEAATRLWEAIDRALTARLHYGEDHPQAAERFDHGFRLVESELMSSEVGLLCNVTPYGFNIGEQVIWEPRDQLDWIPYRAFASGIRVVGLLPGLTRREFHTLLHLLTLDPLADMAPEDDLVTLLWENDLPHVVYREVDTFSEGDQDDRVEFERQRAEILEAIRDASESGTWSASAEASPEDSLTGLVSDVVGENVRAEAVARSLASTSPGEGGIDLASAVELDADALRVLRTQLDQGTESTSQRFYYAAALGYAWARGVGSHTQILRSLILAVEGFAAGSGASALRFVESLVGRIRLRDRGGTTRIRSELVAALMTTPVLVALDRAASRPGEDREDLLDALDRTFAFLNARSAPALLGRIGPLRSGAVLDAVIGLIARHGRGQEKEMARRLTEAPSHVALALLGALAGLGTDEARSALAEATRHPDPVVRVTAMSSLGQSSGPRFAAEMRNMLGHESLDARIKALQAVRDHRIVAATTYVLDRIRQKGFNGLTAAERALTFDCLVDLAPERAESICIELLSDRKLISTPANEETREIAVGVLGRVGTSSRAKQTLETLAKARLGVSAGVKQAAASVLEAMVQRQIGGGL